MTKKQKKLIELARARAVELGRHPDYFFGRGEATHVFFDLGWVAVTVDGKKGSPVFPPDYSLHYALETIRENQ